MASVLDAPPTDDSVTDRSPAQDDLATPPGPRLHQFTMLLAVVVPLLGFGYGFWLAASTGQFGWLEAGFLLGGLWLGGQGITVGYHRLLTHRAFETTPAIRGFFMILGALTVQMSPLHWCAVHRKHHAHSDAPGDPHSPHFIGDEPAGDSWRGVLRGLWHAHTGWLFTGHMVMTDHVRYVPDLVADPLAMFIHRTWELLWAPLSFVVPTLLGWAVTGDSAGAWTGFLWGGLARTFLLHHVTWSVNSICHLFGSRDFVSRDSSRNNLWCALVTSGEGWHNNHHAFPSSARLGLKRSQIDTGWWIIRGLEKLGLAWNVKVPTADQQAKKAIA